MERLEEGGRRHSRPRRSSASSSESGLRGRGGAGYPDRPQVARRAPGSRPGARYVVANGFEADPGAQTDRHADGARPARGRGGRRARRVRGGRDAGHHRRQRSLRHGRRRGSGRPWPPPRTTATWARACWARPCALRIEVRALTGSLVTGEETVLLRALEDRRAQPDQRPPYPAVKGLWGQPTVVNNVQTLAAVPWIVTNGAEAYAAIGSADAPGTMLVQLSRRGGQAGHRGGAPGHVACATCSIVAGGAAGTLKALLVGGPTGGFLPAESLDTAAAATGRWRRPARSWAPARSSRSARRPASWSWPRC